MTVATFVPAALDPVLVPLQTALIGSGPSA